MSSIDLTLNNVGTFFEIGSDITHYTTPVFAVGFRQRIADRALVAVVWPLRAKLAGSDRSFSWRWARIA